MGHILSFLIQINIPKQWDRKLDKWWDKSLYGYEMHIAFYNLIGDLTALYYTVCVSYFFLAQYVLNNQTVKDINKFVFKSIENIYIFYSIYILYKECVYIILIYLYNVFAN